MEATACSLYVTPKATGLAQRVRTCSAWEEQLRDAITSRGQPTAWHVYNTSTSCLQITYDLSTEGFPGVDEIFSGIPRKFHAHMT